VEVYYASDLYFQRECCATRAGLLHNLGLAARNFDGHDLLSICVSCQKNEGTRRRICISVFQHDQTFRRVRATVHGHWNCTADIVWSRESDGDRALTRVPINDGTLLKSCTVVL